MIRKTVACLTFLFVAGCGIETPAPPLPPCPLPVTDAPGFTATLPCDLTLTGNAPPNASVTWLRRYEDADGMTFVLAVQYGAGAQPSVSAPGNFRFMGPLLTGTGDLLIESEIRSTGNAAFLAVVGLLADGNKLLMLIGPTGGQPATAALTFSSVDLTDTDGAGINDEARVSTPRLLAQPADLIAVLDNHTAYRLAQSAAPIVIDWAADDSIVVTPNSAFTEVPQAFFLAQVGQWRSLPGDFIGRSSAFTIDALTDPLLGGVQVTLSDGSRWATNAADAFKLVDWTAGDAIELVRDGSLGSGLTHLMINLKNGDAVAVSFES